jgi:hypothetical protein
MKIEIEVSDTAAALLAAIDPEGDVNMVLRYFVHHALQGVYRPESEERPWLIQMFGDEWVAKLVPGDPYGRGPRAEQVFVKPAGIQPNPADEDLDLDLI